MTLPPTIPIVYFPNILLNGIFPSPLPDGCFPCHLTNILHVILVYSLKLHTQTITVLKFHYSIKRGTSKNQRKYLVM